MPDFFKIHWSDIILDAKPYGGPGWTNWTHMFGHVMDLQGDRIINDLLVNDAMWSILKEEVNALAA